MAVLGQWMVLLSAGIFLAAMGFSFWASVTGLIIWLQALDPRRPRPPKLQVAVRRAIPPEPPRQLPELASRCVICGRPLTNAQSMRARVGSTCIKTYGPRYAWLPNPEHETWQRLLAAAEADRVAEQATLNVAHARAMVLFDQVLKAWAAEKASDQGQRRRLARSTGLVRLLWGIVVWPAGVLLGLAVSLPLL